MRTFLCLATLLLALFCYVTSRYWFGNDSCCRLIPSCY